MSTIVKSSLASNGLAVRVVVDEHPCSPREWDNLGTIYANSRRYNPDNHMLEEFDNGRGEIDTKRLNKDYLYLDIYFYEHGGIALSTTRTGCFADRWDAGLFGIIAVSKEDARKNWGIKRLTPKYKKKVYEILAGEVQELTDYYEGNVYGYEVVNSDEEVLESCYGYYGIDAIEDAMFDGKDVATCYE